jgi:hypothetical protein
MKAAIAPPKNPKAGITISSINIANPAIAHIVK